MCTPFAHGLAGYAVLALGEPQLTSHFRGHCKALGAGFFFGSLADADFLVAYHTNIPFLQHHFFSHSIPFTISLGLLIYLACLLLWRSKRFAPQTQSSALRMAIILTVAYGTHLFLDYFTHDGSPPIGIPLLWPFTDKHFIAPVDLFLSIHRGSMEALFGPHNFMALFREALILGPLVFIAFWKARRTTNSAENQLKSSCKQGR